MNWVLLIEDIMLKNCCLVDYEFPYVVLALRLIDYLNVHVFNELWNLPKCLVGLPKGISRSLE